MLTRIKKIYDNTFTTIRAKLIGIISLIILSSLLLFTTISLNLFQSNMSEMVKLNNGNNAKMMSDKMESELRLQADQLRLLSALSREGSTVMNAYFKDSSDFLLVADYSSLLSEPTKVYFREAKLENLNVTASSLRAHLRFTSEDAKLMLQGKSIIRSLKSPRQSVWLYVVPLAEKGGAHAIAAIMNGDSLAALFAALQTKGASTSLYGAMLVDSDKKLVAHSDRRHFYPADDMAAHPAVDVSFKKFKQNVVTGVQRYSFRDTVEYGSYRKVAIGGAAIITTVNEDIAFAAVRWARITIILIAFIIMTIAILFIYFFSRTISDPLKRLVGATQTIRAGNYDVKVENASRDEVGELAHAFNEMTDGLRERENLKGAFGKFVNKEVAKMVMRGDLALGGESKTATVFFSDIRSFTSMSEKMTPLEVVGFLNEYMTLMVEIVHRYGGVVDKFIGDAIMAIWGAPVTKPNDAENAVLAALEMRAALHTFNQGRGSRAKPIIRIGMGLNTGEVLAGQIGSLDRLEYTVIGDAVNLASRMEGLNKTFGTDILITQNTYELLKKKFVCHPLHKVQVKGKADAQRVYAVMGKTGDSKAPKNLPELHKYTGLYPQKITKKKG
jgi:adenylate cyclase